MTVRTYGIVLGLLVISFAAGRYSLRSPEIKTKDTVKTDIKKEIDRDIHTQTIVTTIKTSDGTIKTVQTIDTVSDTKTKIDTAKSETKTSDIIPLRYGTINVSGLVGNDFSTSWNLKPIYGVSVTKEFLGPITLGGYGLTNGVLGISIGLNF